MREAAVARLNERKWRRLAFASWCVSAVLAVVVCLLWWRVA